MQSKYRIEETLQVGNEVVHYYSIPRLRELGFNIDRLPRSLRIILESVIRNLDGKDVSETNVESILNWNSKDPGNSEIPLKISRVLMQDLTGVPAVTDLAAMRDAAVSKGRSPEIVEPQIPVDLVIDHSVQVDFYNTPDAVVLNQEKEGERNRERYVFLKWAQNAFHNLRVIPPSVGICHQVNLEFLAKVVFRVEKDGKTVAFPDTVLGMDSHTTMVNGLGVLGWGVGGIEAEAAMLNQAVYYKLPQVVGVRLSGSLRPGITATDLVLTITEILRKSKVVDKFVEFFGDGVTHLSVADRATVSNMCPEYGATTALFPVDDKTISYLRLTGRSEESIELIEKYFKAQGLFGNLENIEYSGIIDVDLSKVTPSVAGPKLPQQRVDLGRIGDSFLNFMEGTGSSIDSDSGKKKQIALKSVPVEIDGQEEMLNEGDVVIAAITSCTNTSNPYVMVGAGLLAKKAVELGLSVNKKVKTSLAPGSRVVSDYLERSGLQKYLDRLGFEVVGYGCTTCIGNSGPLNKNIENAIVENNLSTAAVLSGNRNFEARIHRNVRANYLMSPPLVVAFALAGTVTIDMDNESIGTSSNGKPVYLKDIWPTPEEINSIVEDSMTREMYIEKYSNLDSYNDIWTKIKADSGDLYSWDPNSTYIKKPPFFEKEYTNPPGDRTRISGAYPLLVLGDSVTTDHISPAGSFSKDTPAGKYLLEKGVKPEDFNQYGARRGNYEIMTRGTFANNRIRNLLVSREGGFTVHYPDKAEMSVFDAAMQYKKENIPLIVIAGDQYGTGSSRDWAAKGPLLLGVKAIVAAGYERIHRSNLIGMGVLPLQFSNSENFASLDIDPSAKMNVTIDSLEPRSKGTLTFYTKSGKTKSTAELTLRVDTPMEKEYILSGGVLPNVLDKLVSEGR